MLEKIVEIKSFSQDMFLFVCRLTKQLTQNREMLLPKPLQERELIPTEEAFRYILNSQNVHLFVIYDDHGTPVGMLTAGIYRTPSGHRAWLEDIVVDESHRGCGYGEKIVEYAINYIKKMDIDTITLTSNSSRVAANKLYQKMGFERYETNVYRMKLK